MFRRTINGSSNFTFGPFNFFTQKRWNKPADTAQTRLENRTRDLRLDILMSYLTKLSIVLRLHQLMSLKKRGPFVSVQLMSRWNHLVGLNIATGAFLRKYPHIFEVFTHPIKRNICCRFTREFMGLIEEEERTIVDLELENVKKLKKILMMSVEGTVHVHALRLIRRQLGFPEDFRESIIQKYGDDFRLVDLETVALVDKDENLCIAKVEQWREKEYNEKWLSEFETKYAFPIHFPTGFKIEAGFREKLRNWQRLPYFKPYERMRKAKVRTCGGIERFEKRAVGIIHELLNLTVEKMVEVERLVHFRKDLGFQVNIRELVLKHPGIFYVSTKGDTAMVFLREAYHKGSLVEPSPIYVIRRKMLDLILLGCRNTAVLKTQNGIKDSGNVLNCTENKASTRDGHWVIPILESSNYQNDRQIYQQSWQRERP